MRVIIRDEKGLYIPRAHLNKEICQLWGQYVYESKYVTPTGSSEELSWYDWLVTSKFLPEEEGIISWDKLMNHFLVMHLVSKAQEVIQKYPYRTISEIEEEPEDTTSMFNEIVNWTVEYAPYLELIEYFKEKGYRAELRKW